MSDQELFRLLHFIRGSGPFKFLGAGTLSYINRGLSHDRYHEACLELERRGLIRRHKTYDDSILWMPVWPEPDKPTGE